MLTETLIGDANRFSGPRESSNQQGNRVCRLLRFLIGHMPLWLRGWSNLTTLVLSKSLTSSFGRMGERTRSRLRGEGQALARSRPLFDDLMLLGPGLAKRSEYFKSPSVSRPAS